MTRLTTRQRIGYMKILPAASFGGATFGFTMFGVGVSPLLVVVAFLPLLLSLTLWLWPARRYHQRN